MANPQGITIPIDLPRDEAHAFAELLKRTSYEDCVRRSNRLKRYSDGREDADSDEVAQAFRDDLARRSDMMSPGVPR